MLRLTRVIRVVRIVKIVRFIRALRSLVLSILGTLKAGEVAKKGPPKGATGGGFGLFFLLVVGSVGFFRYPFFRYVFTRTGFWSVEPGGTLDLEGPFGFGMEFL